MIGTIVGLHASGCQRRLSNPAAGGWRNGATRLPRSCWSPSTRSSSPAPTNEPRYAPQPADARARVKAGQGRRRPTDAFLARSPTGCVMASNQQSAAVALAARSREVGVATEMLLAKAEQVSDDRACAAGLRLEQRHGAWWLLRTGAEARLVQLRSPETAADSWKPPTPRNSVSVKLRQAQFVQARAGALNESAGFRLRKLVDEPGRAVRAQQSVCGRPARVVRGTVETARRCLTRG
jgi:hypothetical protein